MIKLDFLRADEPLTKTFVSTEEGYDVTPYPFASHVTSTRVEVRDLGQMYDALMQHAALGECLLKGQLANQLQNESRRGQTTPNDPTRFLVLDLDFYDGWESVDEFVDGLHPNFSDVSYIFQHSASAGIKGRVGLRGHVFILLTEPLPPLQLKVWLKTLNFNVPKLNNLIELAANHITLKWPLDITTCQNDKLIYIAPPICTNFEDPLAGQRFVLRKRKHPMAKSPAFDSTHVALLPQWEQDKINELRQAIGLPRRKPKFKQSGDLELLINPSPCVVTGYKTARGFTYLNLNGGDSWAYYFPIENPSIVYNFKGEPPVYLKDIAPEFHTQYTQILTELKRAELTQQLGTDRFETLVLRDIVTDTYYNGYYFPDEDRVQLYKTATVQRLEHFRMQHSEAPPEFIEDWTVTFDPTRLKFYDPQHKWINNYSPSKYLRDQTLKHHEIPPMVDKVLNSITGNDLDSKWHFINWLAYVFQTREKTGTAWIFHGVEGTGKGLLFTKILRPLFGEQHVISGSNKTIEDDFNDSLERACIVFIDELEMDSVRSAAQFMASMKNYITEKYTMVRAMRRSARQVETYWNFIIATNKQSPVYLSATDRRFNVCPPQEKKLIMPQSEIDQIEDELPLFAGFLRTYKVDVAQTRKIIENDSRDALIQSSQTSIDKFFDSLRRGKINYFLSFVAASSPLDNTFYYAAFEQIMDRWVRHAMNEAFCNVSRDELQQVYTYIMGRPIAAAKFAKMCGLYRVKFSNAEVNGRILPCYQVMWGGDLRAMTAFANSRSTTKTLKVVEVEKENTQ